MAFSGAEKNPTGYFATLSLPFTASYEEYKDLLQYAKDQEDRTTIPVITAAYDQSTGELTGAVTFRMYYLRNTDKEYVDFPETGIESGLPNIFYAGEE